MKLRLKLKNFTSLILISCKVEVLLECNEPNGIQRASFVIEQSK
jgi:hypothetical protein